MARWWHRRQPPVSTRSGWQAFGELVGKTLTSLCLAEEMVGPERGQALATARLRHPTRFATTKDPKILDLPPAAWINEPTKDDTTAA